MLRCFGNLRHPKIRPGKTHYMHLLTHSGDEMLQSDDKGTWTLSGIVECQLHAGCLQHVRDQYTSQMSFCSVYCFLFITIRMLFWGECC